MMKKNGFTLAEVLITLSIIGVVATLTLPALMTNTQEQQSKSALKKGINTLTEAAQLSLAVDGFDYASFTSNSTSNEDTLSLYALLSKRTTMDRATSGTSRNSSMNLGADNYTVFFKDGTALSYVPNNTNNATARNPVADGLPIGIKAVFDTNGVKGPNLLSNCSTNAGMVASGNSTDAAAGTTCTKANRVIKDQFGVRLRGTVAVPNGPAARWAFEN